MMPMWDPARRLVRRFTYETHEKTDGWDVSTNWLVLRVAEMLRH